MFSFSLSMLHLLACAHPATTTAAQALSFFKAASTLICLLLLSLLLSHLCSHVLDIISSYLSRSAKSVSCTLLLTSLLPFPCLLQNIIHHGPVHSTNSPSSFPLSSSSFIMILFSLRISLLPFPCLLQNITHHGETCERLAASLPLNHCDVISTMPRPWRCFSEYILFVRALPEVCV